MKWLTYAWRNVARNRRRTVLSSSIVTFGVLALLLSIGFVQASFYGLRESIIGSELGHIQIAEKGAFDAKEDHPMQLGLTAARVEQIDKAMDANPLVRFSTRRLNFEGLLASGSRTVAVIGTGVEPEKETRLSTTFAPIVSGSALSNDRTGANQILLAVELARLLGVGPGDTVTVMATTEGGVLNAVDAKVVGTYKTGVPDLDRRALMMPLWSAQSLMVSDKVSRVVVALRDTEATADVVNQLRGHLQGMDVKPWKDLAPFYNQVVSLYRIIFSVLGIIIAVVVLMSTTNAMLMNIMERVREIGTMRAFGIPERQIQRVLMLEGAIIGALGSSVGIMLLVVVALAINLADIRMPPPPARTSDYPLLIFVRADSCLYVWLGFVALGACAAWIPGRVTRRLSIIEKLNHV